jgi:hypothetical protein
MLGRTCDGLLECRQTLLVIVQHLVDLIAFFLFQRFDLLSQRRDLTLNFLDCRLLEA